MDNEKTKQYRLHVDIQTEQDCIKDVICEVFTPERSTGTVQLRFFPTKEQEQRFKHVFRFAIHGKIAQQECLQLVIEATEVYYREGKQVYWGEGLDERVIIAKPYDLKITHFLNKDDSRALDLGTFWLTSNKMLMPIKKIVHSYTGEVTVETLYRFEFALDNAIQLTFDEHFRYIQTPDKDTICFTELVAEFQANPNTYDMESTLDNLDDLLLLVSFAARQRCSCVGWELTTPSTHIEFYRRDRIIPSGLPHDVSNKTLIEQHHFKQFLQSAYEKLQKSEIQELLRKALYRVVSPADYTLEAGFMSLYASFETIILGFRQEQHLEFILEPDEWKSFSNGLKKYIKKDSLLAGEKYKGQRQRIKEKLLELNRVSFSTAFQEFCQHYMIEVGDLWPVIGHKDGMPLCDIRNMLVHGDTLNPEQEDALLIADLHLRRIVERSLLAVFEWPLHHSSVDPCIERGEKREWLRVKEAFT